MDSTAGKTAEAVRKVEKAIADRPIIVRWLLGCFRLLFPLELLGIGYIIRLFVPAFDTPVFSPSPIDATVWPPLVVLIVLGVTWLLFNLCWVFDREIAARQLQLYVMWSTLLVIVLSVAFGYQIGSKGAIRWWFIVPFSTAVVDVFAAGWGAINNAVQKPFFAEKGRV